MLAGTHLSAAILVMLHQNYIRTIHPYLLLLLHLEVLHPLLRPPPTFLNQILPKVELDVIVAKAHVHKAEVEALT